MFVPYPPATPNTQPTAGAAAPAPAPTAAPATLTIVPPASGTGLPALLVPLLRTGVPFEANMVYRVPPTAPLAAVVKATPAPEWYAITRDHFVGVVDQ